MKTIEQLQTEAIEAGLKVKHLEAVLELARQKSAAARSTYLKVAPGWQGVLEVEAEIANRAARHFNANCTDNSAGPSNDNEALA